MVKKNQNKEKDYWILFKIEVHAPHFTPAYNFDYIQTDSLQAAIKCVIEIYSDKINDAISYLDDYQIEQSEIDEMHDHFEQIVHKMETHSEAPENIIKESEFNIHVGYPSYDLEILASGEGQEFFKMAINALNADDDFTSFLEYILDEEENSELQSLIYTFENLKQKANENIDKGEFKKFLNNVCENIYNDVM